MTKRGGFDDQAATALIGVFRAPSEEFADRLGRYIEGERTAMAELKSIVNKRCPVSFDWHGESIEIAYRPYSERIENEVKGAEDWALPSMKALICAVALDWNITDAGEPVPIDEETLAALPVELQLQLFYAVQNDLRNPQLPSVTSIAS